MCNSPLKLYFLIISILFLAAPTVYAKKHLVVGVYDNKPLAYENTKGKYAGLSIEILEHIASKENWELEYLHGTWPECLKRLKDGETDIQVLIGYTSERDIIYDYTEESIFVAWGQVYTSPTFKALNILDLQGKTIALYKDSLLSISFKNLLKKFDIKSNLIEVENYIAIANEIKAGRADAGIFNRTFAGQYSGKSDLQKTPIVFSPTPIFYAVPEGKHKDVIKAIDTNLSALKEDQNSLYYQSVEKNFGSLENKSIHKWIKWTLIFVTGAFIIISFINIMLKRQVKIQTKELQSKNRLLELEVSERKKNEEELIKWGNIFKFAQWGIALSSADGKKNDLINHAYAEMHGYTVDELLEKEITDILAPSVQNQFPAVIQQCQETGHYTFEGDHVRKDGSTFPAYHDVITVKNDIGDAIYHVLNVRDITYRKKEEKEKAKLESQLRQVYKMEAIGTLAGGIAHDFNNILSAILGFTEMAKDASQPGSTISDDLDKVLEACNRAKSLVQQILAFSRQEETKRIPLDLASIIKQAINMLRPSLPSSIEININIAPKTSPVCADPTQAHQIIINLCTNAFHAMEDTGGKLDISLKEVTLASEDLIHQPYVANGAFIQLSISDSGSGIEPTLKDKIFDPYFTTKETGKGTGMGLAMVHGIVKSYGGFISLYSEIDEGTVFNVFLPVAKQKVLVKDEIINQIPTGKEKILFVDDEEMLANMGKHMLEKLGYQVTVKNSSFDALKIFQKNPEQFDLIITDQTMPGITGSELSSKILKINPDIPIILCTGYSSIMTEEKAKAMGIKEFALKPLARKDIAKLVRKVLDAS
ncbi:MAG: transporter substrate-binding domain-containing protein [Desulfotalea sp.]